MKRMTKILNALVSKWLDQWSLQEIWLKVILYKACFCFTIMHYNIQLVTSLGLCKNSYIKETEPINYHQKLVLDHVHWKGPQTICQGGLYPQAGFLNPFLCYSRTNEIIGTLFFLSIQQSYKNSISMHHTNSCIFLIIITITWSL